MPARPSAPLLALVCLFFCATASPEARSAPRVLVWAPPDQAGGSVDSAALLSESLGRLGVEAAATTDLLAQDLKDFPAVMAVLGMFPRSHSLAASEIAALKSYLSVTRGSLYLEGGDAFHDLDPDLLALLGMSPADDGGNDLLTLRGLDAGVDLDLSGLVARYQGENRSADRLQADAGAGGKALWENRDTGAIHAVFRGEAAGPRSIAVSFEFGGVALGRDEVLRASLIALGILPVCTPPVASLTAAASGKKVRLEWSDGSGPDGFKVRSGGREMLVPAGVLFFEEEPGPGEHLYAVTGIQGDCEGPPRFAWSPIIDGAHLIWRPAETLGGSTDSAGEVRAALEGNGRATVTLPSLAGIDLKGVDGLWAVLGTYPFRHVLAADEGQLLADYLAGGTGPERPRLAIEGGDLWGENPATPLSALDGVRLVARSGEKPLRYLRGLDSGQGFSLASLVRLPVDYTAETNYLDAIEADPAAPGAGNVWVDDLSGANMGVFRRDPAGHYAMLSASFEFGGVTRTREERKTLMALYLDALEGAPPTGARFRRGDVDGDGAVRLNDPIQLLGHLFLAQAWDQDCEDAADADDDGAVGLTDAVVLLSYLFLAGPPTAPPGPDACGTDLTPGDMLPDCHPRDGMCAGQG